MPIVVTCPSCIKQLTFYDSQAGTIASCPFCTIEVPVPRRDTESISTTPTDRESLPQAGSDLSVGPAEMPVLETLPADEPTEEESLELGPRWRQIESAFGWVREGVMVLMVGLSFRFVAVFLSALSGSKMSLIIGLSNLIVGVAGIVLFFGQLFCLRVPAGTRARPAAALSLTSRILSFGLSLYGALYVWDAGQVQGIGRDAALLTAFALLLSGWIASLLADFSLLTLLRRIGAFLDDKAVIHHVRSAFWILIVYIGVLLCLGAVGILLTYQSVLEEIAAYKAASAMLRGRITPDPQPFSWLLIRIANVLFAQQGVIAPDTWSHLIISAVSTLYSIGLGTQYVAALNSAKATIKAGLECGVSQS